MTAKRKARDHAARAKGTEIFHCLPPETVYEATTPRHPSKPTSHPVQSAHGFIALRALLIVACLRRLLLRNPHIISRSNLEQGRLRLHVALHPTNSLLEQVSIKELPDPRNFQVGAEYTAPATRSRC